MNVAARATGPLRNGDQHRHHADHRCQTTPRCDSRYLFPLHPLVKPTHKQILVGTPVSSARVVATITAFAVFPAASSRLSPAEIQRARRSRPVPTAVSSCSSFVEMTDAFFARCFFRFLGNITKLRTNAGGSGLMDEPHCGKVEIGDSQ